MANSGPPMEFPNSRNQNSVSLRTESRFRVILFPIPLQGHINPMIQLANILHSIGFSISILQTDFNSLPPSYYPHFTFHSIPISLSDSAIDSILTDPVAFMLRLNSCRVDAFRECIRGILSDPDSGRVGCLVTDALLFFTQGVADEFKVRRFVLRTSSVFAFLAFSAVPVLRERGYIPIQESRLLELMPELEPYKVKDIYMSNTWNPDDVSRLVTGMAEGMKASSGVIWNTFEDLERDKIAEYSHEFKVPVFPVGPFHKHFPASSSSLLEPDRASLQWLDKQAIGSVLYVSFGSLAQVSETQFEEIAWGLRNSGKPFLWVVRPGSVHGPSRAMMLPEGFVEAVGERGQVVKWAPQQEVLAHRAVGGFWTHCGWNSTLESISEGVPMICHPFFGDQRVNARYMSDVWRVGVHLEGRVERGEIERAIRKVMEDDEGKEMRRRVRKLKEKGEASLRKGGDSYKSLEKLANCISEV